MKKRSNLMKKLILQNFAIILIASLIPIIVFLYLVKDRVTNYMDKNNTKNMEFYKEYKINEIKNFYSNLTNYISEFSDTNLEIGVYKDKLEKRSYIENIYLIDEKFNLNKVLFSDKQFPDMLDVLKKANFTNDIYIGKFIRKDNRAYQYIYKKIIDKGNLSGYVCFVINNNFLDEYVKLDSTKNSIDIYNDEYYIIDSTDENKKYALNIDFVSKKMLDGNIGTEVKDDIKYNYGFINLGDNSLYIIVYNYQNNLLSDVDNILTLMKFISIIILIGVFIIAWKFVKNIIDYTIMIQDNKNETESYSINVNLKEKIEDSINLCNRLIEIEGEIVDIKSKLSEINQELDKKRGDLFEG